MTNANVPEPTVEEAAAAQVELQKRGIQPQISMLCSHYVSLGGDLSDLSISVFPEPAPVEQVQRGVVPDPNDDPEAIPEVDRAQAEES